jgi:hypothetical protein
VPLLGPAVGLEPASYSGGAAGGWTRPALSALTRIPARAAQPLFQSQPTARSASSYRKPSTARCSVERILADRGAGSRICIALTVSGGANRYRLWAW